MSTRDRKVTSEPAHLQLSSPEDVGAIAVDTNVYKEYGFRVRSQPLVELAQVKELGIKWLLPEFWETASWFNPVLHMVNAFRYGLLGVTDVPLWIAYAVMLGFTVGLGALALNLLTRGVGLRS